MSSSSLRWFPAAVLIWGTLAPGGCYRAELDFADASAGGAPDASAGTAGAGGRCDAAQITGDDLDCRLRLPTRAQCSEQDPSGWDGCYNGGCTVCADVVQKFPYYFSWHPCCDVNPSCTSQLRVKCNERCPPPVAHDQVMPCWLATTDY